MQKFHELWQIGFQEVVRPHSRVESLQAEINRVRAISTAAKCISPPARAIGQAEFRRRGICAASATLARECFMVLSLKNTLTVELALGQWIIGQEQV
jgi:hypothetical protein